MASAFVRSLLMLAFIEGCLWTLAAVGAISLPSSVPLDYFDEAVIKSNAGTNKRLYEPDRWTLTRLRPNADITYPRHPTFLHGPRTYEVRTNALGMRGPEITEAKPSGILRIACLGDSVTFGYNVAQDASYPAQLQRLLDAAYPAKFQVLNFGVPGYTSLQGLAVLQHRVLAFRPDVVTFAFGTNDRFWHGPEPLSAQLHFSQSAVGTALFMLKKVCNYSATYRALRVVLFRLGEIQNVLPSKPGKIEPHPAIVGLAEMVKAIEQVHALAQRDRFALVLLNVDLHHTDSVSAVVEAAERTHTPFIDMVQMLDEQCAQHAFARAARYRLMATSVPTPASHLVFRVVAEGRPQRLLVRHHRFLDPNVVTEPMYDDGTHGDEHAGDGVWSLTSPYRPGAWISYSYFMASRAAPATREWQDAFLVHGVPVLGTADRSVKIRIGMPAIDVYGSWCLQADDAHPNAEGHALIAQRLRDAILQLPQVRRALAGL